jgi:hypothetical protein
MRGDAGDAMARMKRWDAVRQRLEDAGGGPERIVDEVVQAISDVVGQHHNSLTVTVTVDDSGSLATVRIVRRDGRLEVTRLQPQPVAAPPPPPPTPPAPPPPRAPAPPPQHSWRPAPADSLEQAAARLAELVRQDPSLLEP